MAPSANDVLHHWSQGSWNHEDMMCQQRPNFIEFNSIWTDPYYPQSSDPKTSLLLLCVIMLVVTLTSYVLRPVGLPLMSKMFGGLFVIGVLYNTNALDMQALLHPTIKHILKTCSYLGFIFYSFILGVETNMETSFKKVNKYTITICMTGFILSIATSYSAVRLMHLHTSGEGIFRTMLLISQNFFMVTCNHVSELKISNTELGRLACAVSLFLDFFVIVYTYVAFHVIFPIKKGDYWHPVVVTGTYIMMFGICRPIVTHLANDRHKNGRVKDGNFLAIILVVLGLSFLNIQARQPLGIFMFGFFLPQEPLASLLAERLDAISSSVFFPIFCAMHGFNTSFGSLRKKSILVEIFILTGAFGKFIGTVVPAMFFGIPLWQAVSLGIIISSNGLFDIIMVGQLRDDEAMTAEQYTIVSLHTLFCTGAFLPLVRHFYKPSNEYSCVIRQGVLTAAQTGKFKVLSCIYREENLPGLIRLLEAFHPTDQNPIPIYTLQLIQLTAGRVSLPILSPLNELQNSSAFGSNLHRANRIVIGMLGLERRTHGAARLLHYVSVSSPTVMHNDICTLAHEKSVNLIILPFHVQGSSLQVVDSGGHVENSPQAIREVNKMVLKNAPCSVGMLIERDSKRTISHLDNNLFRVVIFFIGGADDHDALAYTNVFASQPNIMLTIVWLKARTYESNTNKCDDDYGVIQDFHDRFEDNERVGFEEVIVKDGAETTNVVVKMKEKIDLAIVGRYHDPLCGPLFGLTDRWCEYPELGIFGDMLVSPDFQFSVLVVQQEPLNTNKKDEDGEFGDDDTDNDEIKRLR